MLTQQESDNGLFWKAGDFVGCSWIKVCNNFVNLRVDGRLEATKLPNGDPVVKVKKWFISIVYAPEKGTTTLASHDVPDQHPNPKWNLVRDGIWGELPGDDSPGQAGPWDYSAKTTEVVEDVHLTGQLGWISLCARARGVDPQSAQFFPENPTANVVQAATIYLTYYPNDPPGPGDYAQAAVGSDGGPYPTDALNNPDIIWEPLTGGGAGIP